MLTLALLAALQVPPAIQKKLDAARAAVEKAPDDAAANFALGKLLCFDAGDWEGGLPHLAKALDKDLSPVAAKDLEPRATVEDSLAMADAWLQLGKKQKAIAGRCTDRALFHYAEAWPKMEAGVAKEKMRERLKQLQMKGPESKTLGTFPGGDWANLAPTDARSGLDKQYARSGQFSVKVLGYAEPLTRAQSWFRTEEYPCKPGDKFTFSCWVLTQGGETAGPQLMIRFKDAGGRALSNPGPKTDGDLPIWRKLEGEATAPEGTVKVDFGFYREKSKSGVAFVDDMSLKMGDREVLKNGSFEGR